jgi:hypothetical protein
VNFTSLSDDNAGAVAAQAAANASARAALEGGALELLGADVGGVVDVGAEPGGGLGS